MGNGKIPDFDWAMASSSQAGDLQEETALLMDLHQEKRANVQRRFFRLSWGKPEKNTQYGGVWKWENPMEPPSFTIW